MCGSTSDIISDLPNNVKKAILLCLSIQDAVRTSVLSTKWRYMWANLPQLVFDDMFCRESIRKRMNKLLRAIYQVLLLHRGPIHKFTLSLSRLKGYSVIDQLILFVSNNGIQELTLHIWKGECYKLPSSLFSCLELKILILSSCIFKPPPKFKGFIGLLFLEFYEVGITADIFSSLISGCPLLEHLIILNSTYFGDLEIAAPNLIYLFCGALFSSICFKNTLQLARVTFCLNMCANEEVFNKGKSSMVMLFDSLPVIASLQLDYYYAKIYGYNNFAGFLSAYVARPLFDKRLNAIARGLGPESWARPFCGPTDISTYDTVDDVIVDPVLELLEMQDWSDVSLNQLREVEMTKLSGTRSELEFIMLLLAKSQMLETMHIEPNSANVVDGGLMILKEVTRFRRLSPQAEIKFKNPV
ncbi:F-box/FBD/LRR-repeat protein At1g13570-like [Camellia sinensis]|uniref:F-box/FBD/LRR-repeat protein At1g13570-like n=1 Tax=Camellia sinensis TaxID=4442 RepID=UPI001035D764|nr:F-box/FBD/LRR-repeat protein At1g13570-like [Camellia sinensis]